MNHVSLYISNQLVYKVKLNMIYVENKITKKIEITNFDEYAKQAKRHLTNDILLEIDVSKLNGDYNDLFRLIHNEIVSELKRNNILENSKFNVIFKNGSSENFLKTLTTAKF